MKVKFTKNFAGNWKVGDIVEVKPLEEGEVLVDGVAAVDSELLLQHCQVISKDEANKRSGVKEE